jgi:hypothetical protein
VVEEPSEVAGADHPRLVDDHHRPCRQTTARPGELGEQVVEGARGDAGAVLQAGGSPRRQRAADHPDARGLPGLPCGVERERLAAAGFADHHRHPRPVGGQRPNHSLLLMRQAGAAVQRGN